MASSPLLAVEDHTDEDFFDRLVEDDFGDAGSEEGSIKMDHPLSRSVIADETIRLDHSDDSKIVSVGEDQLERITNEDSHIPGQEAEWMPSFESSDLFSVVGDAKTIVSDEKFTESVSSRLSSEAVSEFHSDLKSEIISPDSSVESSGSKSTEVKEIQWSAFFADSQQEAEPFSDFLIENSDVSTSHDSINGGLQYIKNYDHDIDLVSSEKQDAHIYCINNGSSPDANDPNYWENMYPGWKFDHSTGQWYQIADNDAAAARSDSHDASNVNMQGSFRDDHLGNADGFISGKTAEVSYSQQTSTMMVGRIAEDCKTDTVSNWNQYSQVNNGYPPNMMFDSQYPGWYFDTNTQQWSTIDAYTQSIQQPSNSIQNNALADVNTSNCFIGVGNLESSSFYGRNEVQEQGGQNKAQSWDGSTNDFAHNNSKMIFSGNNKLQDSNYSNQQMGSNSKDSVHSSIYSNNNGPTGFNLSIPGQSPNSHLSQNFYANEKGVSYHDNHFNGAPYPHTSYSGNEGRSSAGRPSHALVTFGFGGKLIVMKDPNFFDIKTGYCNGGSSEASILILNLMEVVKDQVGKAGDYFHSLSQQSFPGPLVGGNAASKDVYKWIDESIMHCETVDPKKGKLVKLLLSLLKISSQHHGNLRSPFGSDTLEENDGPESSVTKLFASVGADRHHLTPCMQSIPSEAHILATSIEMQNLLISGRRLEALQCAQAGQLWGPALVLAARLGEKFYVDTMKQMAQRLLVCGSPLRTLCLLIAGQPADVFSTESFNGSFSGNGHGAEQLFKAQSNSMLDNWEENLAILTANRTKDDELVMIHLGDSLWKERGEVIAAHMCYLAAEANFEPYSDSARLCLIGADHWNFPRTFACPDAIQRTELYEYAKVLGNSQFVFLPFQPYKFIYANMLAEIGKTSDSLRYCQSSLKLLRYSNRSIEVDMWKSLFSALEDRLSAHHQGGYGESLGATNLVGKLFTSIDRSLHRVMGAPASLPPMPHSSVNGKEGSHKGALKVVNTSRPTNTILSLNSSASVNGMMVENGASDCMGSAGRKIVHGRSISEPDFGRTPKHDVSGAGEVQNKASASRFSRIGSQFFQKTMGWVSKSRQAKLGESNKFYYDEKLKRWVEEGAEPPAVEAALPPPPPKAASFQNGITEYSINSALKNQDLSLNGGPVTKPMAPNSGIPPNQFMAAHRTGVRSRYVDTFNRNGTNAAGANSFQSPSAPAAIKLAAGAKFFVPAAPAISTFVEDNGDLCNSLPTTAAQPPGGLQNGNGSSSQLAAAPWSDGGWNAGSDAESVPGVIPPPPPSFLQPNPAKPLQHFNSEDLDEVELS